MAHYGLFFVVDTPPLPILMPNTSLALAHLSHAPGENRSEKKSRA